jgi:hypothetical protein
VWGCLVHVFQNVEEELDLERAQNHDDVLQVVE